MGGGLAQFRDGRGATHLYSCSVFPECAGLGVSHMASLVQRIYRYSCGSSNLMRMPGGRWFSSLMS